MNLPLLGIPNGGPRMMPWSHKRRWASCGGSKLRGTWVAWKEEAARPSRGVEACMRRWSKVWLFRWADVAWAPPFRWRKFPGSELWATARGVNGLSKAVAALGALGFWKRGWCWWVIGAVSGTKQLSARASATMVHLQPRHAHPSVLNCPSLDWPRRMLLPQRIMQNNAGRKWETYSVQDCDLEDMWRP